MPILYELFGDEATSTSIFVEFSTDMGRTWNPATQGPCGDGISGLSALPTGIIHTYCWDSMNDLGVGTSYLTRIRITPRNEHGTGVPHETGNFTVVNPAALNVRRYLVHLAPLSGDKSSLLAVNNDSKIDMAYYDFAYK